MFAYLENLSSSQTLWLAFSGGLDSTVLLHLIKTQFCPRFAKQIKVAHINHGLSSQAKQWELHCADVCRKLNLSYQAINVDAKPKANQSPEAAARNARYQAFAQLLKEDDYLVTAHHQDDQIETLFLQLFRGAGPKGLAAMPVRRKFNQGYLLRPLLNFSRTELETYAKVHQLTWIDDESNFDTSYDRNFIRQQLLPVIKKRWPSVGVTITRTTKHCAATVELLDNLAQIDFSTCYHEQNKTLFISKLKLLSSSRQDNLIRYWLRYLQLPMANNIKLDEIMQSLLTAREDAKPLIYWPGVEIRRYRDEIFASAPLITHDSHMIISWDLTKDLVLPNNLGVLSAVVVKTKINIPDNAVITVRFRQGGEKIKLPKRQGHHQLKKLLQEWGVPPWLRDRIPLVFVNEELVWVGYGGRMHANAFDFFVNMLDS